MWPTRSRHHLRCLSALLAGSLTWLQCVPAAWQLSSPLAYAASTFTLNAVSDTYLRKGSPNKNQGTESILRLRDGGDNRALVRFDQAAIVQQVAGGQLVSARLELTISRNGDNWGPAGRTIDLHRMTKAWTELGATWSCC